MNFQSLRDKLREKKQVPVYSLIIIPLMAIIIGMIIYRYMCLPAPFNDKELNFRPLKVKLSPVDRPTAEKNMDNYRETGAFFNLFLAKKGKTNIITHEHKSMLEYFKDIFPKFVSTHTDIPDNFHWEIGIYPFVSKVEMKNPKEEDDTITRLRICTYFIPTLRGNTNHKTLDYLTLSLEEKEKYYKIDKTKTFDESENEFIYDEGALDP